MAFWQKYSRRRILAFAVFVLLVAEAVVFIGGRLSWRFKNLVIPNLIEQFSAAGWLGFGVGQVLVAASGILPASVMAMAAGGLYGMVGGLIVSVLSTMLGGWLAFALSRTALRGWIARLLARHKAMSRLDSAMQSEGWRLVLLLRISPVMPFALTSYGLGLTGVRQRDYLIGTLASLPSLLGYVALGALGRAQWDQGRVGLAHGNWLVLLAGAALVAYAMWRLKAAMERIAHREHQS